MKIAVVDIDGILWNMADVWYEELKKVNPECPYPGSTGAWYFHKGYMTDEQFQETVDIIHMKQHIYSCFKDAGLLTKALHQAGFYVKIASHRITNSYNSTRAWLIDNDIYFDELYTVEDKHFLLEDATIFIDDSPASQELALSKGVATFSIEYLYNTHMDGVFFAKDFRNLLADINTWLEGYSYYSPSEDKTVTISEAYYMDLLYNSALLASLEAAGVDNWEGYSEALNNLK